jgi:hypothetical protein
MSISTIYRVCIWLPILVPATVVAVANTLNLRLSAGVAWEVLAYSLFYGGVPYAVLAAWATWWVGGRSEAAIRRLMFRAPLLMAAVFASVALVVGFAVGVPGPFTAVAVLGCAIILPLGYLYVGLAILLRRGLCPPALADARSDTVPRQVWSRVDPAEFRRLDLRACELLADVPLHDVWTVELPGGGPGRTLADARAFMSAENLMTLNPVVRALFLLRALLGRIFGWDSSMPTVAAESFIHRLSDEDRKKSVVEPGSPDGPFTVMYVHPFEAVSEIRNATVHGFSVFAFKPCSGGYRLFWAIYVAPVSRVTALYMAVIDPFRRTLIYPALLRHVHESWCARFTACRQPR